MTLMSDDYLRHLRRDGAALAAAVERDPSAEVSGMPGYDTGSLCIHTGAVHRWQIAIVEGGAEVSHEAIPPPPPDYLSWFREGVSLLASTLESAGPDHPVWTFRPDGPTSGTTAFWFRRAAQETSIHRWDAERAVGEPAPIEPVFAIDGIDELFEVFVPRRDVSGLGAGGETIHLHATDTDGEWLIRLAGEKPEITREHAKGDVAARGRAEDLLLFLYNRVGVEPFEVFGDASLLDRWAAVQV